MADNETGKMAIKSQPNALAKKLIKKGDGVAGYVDGTAGKAGVKAFADAHSVLHTKLPYGDEAEQDKNFNATNIKKDNTTGSADLNDAESEKAIFAGVKQKVTERFVRKFSESAGNTQKALAIKEKGAEAQAEKPNEKKNATSQPPAKIHTKLPPQTESVEADDEFARDAYGGPGSGTVKQRKDKKTGKVFFHAVSKDGSHKHFTSEKAARKHAEMSVDEEIILEVGGDPMSPAPATSADPGTNDAQPPDNTNNSTEDKEPGGEDDDDEGGSDSAKAAKNHLEKIALSSADLYENIPDDVELPEWAMEKLEMASKFLEQVAKAVDEEGGDSDEDDEEGKEQGENGGEPDPKAKPDGNGGNQSKMAMSSESVNEAAYSAKAGREGKDLGKPGKNFSKIASKAGKEYGSKKAGEKVAGAILAKIRAKHGA